MLHPHEVTTAIGVFNVDYKRMSGNITLCLTIKPPKSLVSSIAQLPLYCCTSYCYNCEMQSPATTSSDRVDPRVCSQTRVVFKTSSHASHQARHPIALSASISLFGMEGLSLSVNSDLKSTRASCLTMYPQVHAQVDSLCRAAESFWPPCRSAPQIAVQDLSRGFNKNVLT